jgi:hypothetical protein
VAGAELGRRAIHSQARRWAQSGGCSVQQPVTFVDNQTLKGAWGSGSWQHQGEYGGERTAMGWRRNKSTGASWLIATLILAAAGTGAAAQAPPSDNETKILRCRQNELDLLWLDREQLRTRCGLWSKSYIVKTTTGEVERIVYSRYFVVTLRNGQVSNIRQRRQIFTGFKKKTSE